MTAVGFLPCPTSPMKKDSFRGNGLKPRITSVIEPHYQRDLPSPTRPLWLSVQCTARMKSRENKRQLPICKI